jgi:hypothetical protein
VVCFRKSYESSHAWAGGVPQMVEYLPHKHKALNLLTKSGFLSFWEEGGEQGSCCIV